MSNVYIVADAANVVESKTFKESDSKFVCDDNYVMVGRYHTGDENGSTQYKQAPMIADPNSGVSVTVTTGDHAWSDEFKEANSNYQAPEGKVITGRQHSGDENGKTSYRISSVYVNSELVRTSTSTESVSPPIKESAGIWYDTPGGVLKEIITGRKHDGDENGNTWYYSRLCLYNE